MSYRLDSHCDGTAKNSDEKEVTVGQCKATTEAREQGKSDQLGLGHIHPVCEFECGKARPDPPLSRTTGRDLSPRTLAGRRRDQPTKALDYGAVLVAIAVAQFYLSGMSQRTLPAGFIAPCLPTKTVKLPSGSQWLHEIKHDGFRGYRLSFLAARSGVRRGQAILSGAPKAERIAAPKHIINVSYPGLCSIEQHI
jgi:hypothetical protein